MAEEPSNATDQLDALYREHSRELWAIFYSLCSDPERSYDAVQEAFLRFHSYDGEPHSGSPGVAAACWAELVA